MDGIAHDLGRFSSEQRRLLLAEMLRKKSYDTKERPLSLGQERLWLFAELNPDVPVYNVSVAYHLHGPLDLSALERSIRLIQQRHEVLRTTFPIVDGRPVQRIAAAKSSEPPFTVFELDCRSEAEQEQCILQHATDQARQSFDLSRGPLWVTGLLRVTSGRHVIVITMHHISTDGWSFSLFCQELCQLYSAFKDGLNSPLSDLPTQYADFAQKQREALAGPQFEEQRTYWKEHLSGSVTKLKLPTDGHGGLSGNHRGSNRPFQLTKELSLALAEWSQLQNSTLFMVLLSGFQALLHRETGQQELLICTPVTGRHRSQSKELIGYFNNILPMRFDLRGDPNFQDLVGRTRRVALDAYKNQDVPIQWIVDLPGMQKVSPSRLLFSLDMEWPPRLELAGLATEGLSIDNGAADFDMSVSLWTTQGEIFGNVKFNAGLFEESGITRLIDEYRLLLAELLENSGQSLSSLPQRAGKPLASGMPEAELESLEGSSEPASTPLELKLARECEEVLGIRPIGAMDDLLALGASSLAVAQLAHRIQKSFHSDLPITAIFRARTVERIAMLLKSHDHSLLTSSLAPIQPKGNRPPLFLCEGVGIYFPLVTHLLPDQPVYGLATELTENYPRVEDLASHYVREILAVQPEGPYFLGGVSFGGIVAFEVAQQLFSSGQEVAFLALMDTPGPDAFRSKPPLRRVLGHLGNLRRFGYPYLRSKISPRLGRLWKRLIPRSEDSALASPRLLEDHAQLRAFFSARASQYKIGPYSGRITLFQLDHRDGMSDSLFDPALVEVDPLLGWGSVPDGGVDAYELPGGHLSILMEPHVRILGEKLRVCLENVQRHSTVS